MSALGGKADTTSTLPSYTECIRAEVLPRWLPRIRIRVSDQCAADMVGVGRAGL